MLLSCGEVGVVKMRKIKVINPQAVDEFLNAVATQKTGFNYSQLFDLLQITLKRHIVKNRSLLRRVETSSDMQENRDDICGAVYAFDPSLDKSLRAKVEHVADWLYEAREKGDISLKGLAHLPSIDHAYREADKYFLKRGRKTTVSSSFSP